MRDEDDIPPGWGRAALLLSAGVVLFALTASWFTNCTNVRHVSGIIEEKYVKRTGEGDNFFVVVKTSAGKEVFSNKDSFWWWKFNSADLQAATAQGEEVNLLVAGYRCPILSWFPNVVELED